VKDIRLYEHIPLLENRFSVKFFALSRYSFCPMWHEHMELAFYTKGSATVFCDNKRFCVEAGDLIAVNSTEIHALTDGTPAEFFCMLIYPSFTEDIDLRGKRLTNHIRQDETVKKYFHLICEEQEKNDFGSDMMIKGYAYELLAYLFRHYARDTAQNILKEQEEKLARLDRVFQYVSTHYAEKISLTELSELCFLSDSYFCRFFKKAVGCTAIEYITDYRLEKAAWLLKSTNSTVSEIATSTGFDDANYFAKVFRKKLGMTPIAYRKQDTAL